MDKLQTKREVEAVVAAFFANELESPIVIRNLQNDAHIFRDLGFDSLDALSLIMDIEDHFKLEILDAEAEQLVTIEQIVELLNRKLGRAG